MSTCPVCHQADQVQRVAAVVSGGVGTSSGVALAAPLMGHGSAQGAVFNSVTATNLAQRLSGPPRPRFRFIAAFFLWWIVAEVAIFLFGVSASRSNGAALGIFFAVSMSAIAIVAAIIVTFLHRAVAQASIARKTEVWNVSYQRMMDAYYCFRDDIVFNDQTHARPEVFASQVFLK